MKFKSLLLFALAALLTLAAPRPSRAQEVSFDFFYDALSPYGEWIEVGDYGYCWRPSGVDEEWTPYADGYWSYTDAGWTWVSYEEFGGIVYHYGRWTKLEDEGWCWVPDYEWGPAWVSWRNSDDYVGWAPLPAEARWEQNRGISVWADTSYDIGPSNYNFCRSHDFGAPVLRAVIIPRRENIVIINHTVNITNITYNRDAGCVFNGGLDYGYVNRFSRRRVPALKLVRDTNITVVNNQIVNNNVRVTNFNSVQRGNQLTVIAPRVVQPPRERIDALLKPKITKVIPQQKVTRGWGSVPAAERAAIRAKFQQETEGKTPDTMPAKPVRTADLKVVPVKADPKAKLPVINRDVPEVAPIVKNPDATTNNPGVMPPTVPPGKIAGEKGPGRKPGKFATPPLVVPGNTAENPPQPVIPGVVKPFNPSTADENPSGTGRPKTAAEISRERAAAAAAAKQRAMQENDQPSNTSVTDRPKTAAEISRERAAAAAAARQQAQQGNDQPPTTSVIDRPKTAAEISRERTAAAAAAKQRAMQENNQPPNTSVTDRPKTAAEISRERTAAAAAAKQRALQGNDQPPEIAPRNNAQDAAAARMRIQQQQQQQQRQMLQNQQDVQEQAAARKRATDAQQLQQNQQQQMLRQRSADAAEAKQRAMQNQQSQAAEAREKAQMQRNMPPPVQRNIVPQQQVKPLQVQPQRVPPKNGKKPLTPEEAAQLR